MKTKFNKIPETLQNAVIGFGGTLPGVGKSFTKYQWASILGSIGYQAIITGSTNKASDGHKTIYSIADWTDMKATRAAGAYVRKPGKIFPQRSAFILIDEAWMLSQKDLVELKVQFPKCCFLLFGDPNQFPPVENHEMLKIFDEMQKDQYNVHLQELRNLIKEGLRRPMIQGVDIYFNLTEQYRVKTPGLENFIINIKNGFEDLNSMLKFMDEHKYNEFDDADFAICRTWNSGVYKWADYDYKGAERIFKNLKQGVRGVYVGQNNIGAIKNAIYDGEGQSYDSTNQITDLSLFKDERNYQLQGAVTCHSIQGSTFRKGSKIVVDIDNALCLMDDDYREDNEELYEDFQKFMYIACSRVQEDDDILFKCNDLGKFCKIASFCKKMPGLPYDVVVDTTSEELCSIENPVEYLVSLMEKYNIKPKKPETTKKSRFNLSKRLSEDIKSSIYNKLEAGEVLSNNWLIKKLNISSRTFYENKTEILDAINKMVIEVVNNKEKNEVKNEVKNKTIGEIVDEMERDRPPVVTKFGDFNVLWLADDEKEAFKIFNRIAHNRKMDIEDKFEWFRRYLLENRSIEWVSPL